MSDEKKPEENAAITDEQEGLEQQELKSRRDFLRSLGKWSAIIIGTAVGGGLLDTPEASGWVNGGAAWVNARGGGGTAGWVNRSGGWINGGAAWVNRSVGWVNGGAAWVNRSGGSAGWVNRSGGGGTWVNRRGY